MDMAPPLMMTGDALESADTAPTGYVVRDFNVCRSGNGLDGRGLSPVFLESLVRATNYMATERGYKVPLRIGHTPSFVAGDGEGQQESYGYAVGWRTIPDATSPGDCIVQATCYVREGCALEEGCVDGTYPMRSISYSDVKSPVFTKGNRLVGQVFDHLAFLGRDPANFTEDTNYSAGGAKGPARVLAGLADGLNALIAKVDGLFRRASALPATAHAAQAGKPDDQGVHVMDPEEMMKVAGMVRQFLSELAAKAAEYAAMLPGEDTEEVTVEADAAAQGGDPEPPPDMAAQHKAAAAKAVKVIPAPRQAHPDLTQAEAWAVAGFRREKDTRFSRLVAGGHATEEDRDLFDAVLAARAGDPAEALDYVERRFGARRVMVPPDPALLGDGSPAQMEYHKQMALWKRMGDQPLPFEKWQAANSRTTAGVN